MHMHILHHVAATLTLEARPPCAWMGFFSTFSLWILLSPPLSIIPSLSFHSYKTYCMFSRKVCTQLQGMGDGVIVLSSLPKLGLVKLNSAAPAFPSCPRSFLKLAERIHSLSRVKQAPTEKSAISWNHRDNHAFIA